MSALQSALRFESWFERDRCGSAFDLRENE